MSDILYPHEGTIDLIDGGHTNGIMLTWNKDEHHLDIEIHAEGRIEVFYRNRSTDEATNHELPLTPDIAEAMVRAIGDTIRKGTR